MKNTTVINNTDELLALIEAGGSISTCGNLTINCDVPPIIGRSIMDIEVAGDFICTGELYCCGDLKCGGELHSVSGLYCAGDIHCAAGLYSSGDLQCDGDLSCDGLLYCRGKLNCGGDLDCRATIQCDYALNCSGTIKCASHISCDGPLLCLDMECGGDLYCSVNAPLMCQNNFKCDGNIYCRSLLGCGGGHLQCGGDYFIVELLSWSHMAMPALPTQAYIGRVYPPNWQKDHWQARFGINIDEIIHDEEIQPGLLQRIKMLLKEGRWSSTERWMLEILRDSNDEVPMWIIEAHELTGMPVAPANIYTDLH